MDPEEEKMINEAFAEIYKQDPKLRALLGENVENLGISEKRQILLAIKEKGGLGDEEHTEVDPAAEYEASFVIHNGKRFDRVQIEEDNNEYLMDEDGNLYD